MNSEVSVNNKKGGRQMNRPRLLNMTVGLCLILMLALVVSAPAFAEVIELIANDHNPAPSTAAQAWDEWAQWVNKRSQGKVKVIVHHSGDLLKGDEAFRGTQTGIVDFAHYVMDRRDGLLLNTVITLPFMGYPPQLKTSQLYMDLLGKFPDMAKEWKGIKVIGAFMMPPTHIHTTNKVIRTPADLRGMKMHGAEVILVQVLGLAGASAVQLDIGDMDIGLNRGLLDGVMNNWPAVLVFKGLPLLPYHTIFGTGGINMTPMLCIMNLKKFNSLPRDVQKILEESGQVWRDVHAKFDVGCIQTALGFAKENGHTFTELTDKEIKVWYDLVKKPIHDKWIKDTEAKGLPGKAVYKYALKLAKKYSK